MQTFSVESKQLDETGLVDGLSKRTIFAHGESVVTPLNQEQAVDIRSVEKVN